mmetsp:Transcript_4646/g.17188  ORF Transcript_4646/g.17188 Transcript_4646/m.17188 type:complete len:330 (+) Transcript_4646:965-1954(+)
MYFAKTMALSHTVDANPPAAPLLDLSSNRVCRKLNVTFLTLLSPSSASKPIGTVLPLRTSIGCKYGSSNRSVSLFASRFHAQRRMNKQAPEPVNTFRGRFFFGTGSWSGFWSPSPSTMDSFVSLLVDSFVSLRVADSSRRPRFCFCLFFCPFSASSVSFSTSPTTSSSSSDPPQPSASTTGEIPVVAAVAVVPSASRLSSSLSSGSSISLASRPAAAAVAAAKTASPPARALRITPRSDIGASLPCLAHGCFSTNASTKSPSASFCKYKRREPPGPNRLSRSRSLSFSFSWRETPAAGDGASFSGFVAFAPFVFSPSSPPKPTSLYSSG